MNILKYKWISLQKFLKSNIFIIGFPKEDRVFCISCTYQCKCMPTCAFERVVSYIYEESRLHEIKY